MGKGEQTRKMILRAALDKTSEVGLEGLTLGMLAREVGMSKSGLYAHFDSKEALQCKVLDAAADRFVDVVLAPALKEPRGLPRVRALFHRWLQWETGELTGGCPFVGAASEYDDRPGPVRDRLVGHLQDLLGAIRRAATISVEEGHFREDLDVDQFAFETWGILLAFHQFGRLLDQSDAAERAETAFLDLIERSSAAH